MAKEPQPGRVKTRLGREIGMEKAADWYQQNVEELVRHVDLPDWDLILSIAPASALKSEKLPAGPKRISQPDGDLGERMAEGLLKAPPGPVLLIGSDIPSIRAHHLTRAFALLTDHDAVFGPAQDGGFWLAGLSQARKWPATGFQNCRWSTPDALVDAERSLVPLRLARADMLADVDCAADLAQIRADVAPRA